MTFLTPSAKKILASGITFLLFVMVLSADALAGQGGFNSRTGEFNFCVTVRFNATAPQLSEIRARFERASQIITDATDGRHRFGTVQKRGASLAPAEDVEIRLDYAPSSDSISTYVLLHEDGNCQVIRYKRYQSAVVARYQGVLPKADIERLLASVRSSAFRKALRRESYGFTERGELILGEFPDFFYLSVKAREGVTRKATAGDIEAAPAVVRKLAQELLAIWKRLDNSPLADAYVRSQTIDRERLASLRREGKLRFATVHEFPHDLQPIIVNAIDHPNDFYPLSQSQYDQLLMRWRLLINDGSGYEMHLFRSLSESAPIKNERSSK